MNKSPELNVDLPTPESGERDWPWSNPNRNKTVFQESDGPWPKISIVTPSFNQGKFIEKTIRSVLLQNYPNLEYIVIDGGSTDDTVDIIKKYEMHLTFWESEKDNGQADALNKGFSRATGEIYAWLNSDDYYLPDTLLKVVKAFWENSKAGAIVGIGHKVSETGEIKYTPKVPELNFNAFLDWSYSHFMQPSCFFKAKAWKDCGPLREDLYFCMDVDLWLKISQKYKFVKVNDCLSHALIHPNAKTTAEKERMKVETSLMVLQHGAFQIARDNLMKMADENFLLKDELKKYKHRPWNRALRSVKRVVKGFVDLIK